MRFMLYRCIALALTLGHYTGKVCLDFLISYIWLFGVHTRLLSFSVCCEVAGAALKEL